MCSHDEGVKFFQRFPFELVFKVKFWNAYARMYCPEVEIRLLLHNDFFLWHIQGMLVVRFVVVEDVVVGFHDGFDLCEVAHDDDDWNDEMKD